MSTLSSDDMLLNMIIVLPSEAESITFISFSGWLCNGLTYYIIELSSPMAAITKVSAYVSELIRVY